MKDTGRLFGSQLPSRATGGATTTRRSRSLFPVLALAVILLPASAAWAGLTASVTLQTAAPTNIRPGEITTLEITLANNNSLAAITAAAFSNSLPGVLPNGLKVAGAPTYTCFNPVTSVTSPGVGTLTAAVGTQPIQLSGGVIPARNSATSTDGSCTILVPVTAGSSDGTGTAYTYTIANGAVTGNDGAAVANIGAVRPEHQRHRDQPADHRQDLRRRQFSRAGRCITRPAHHGHQSRSGVDPNFSVSDKLSDAWCRWARSFRWRTR